MSNPSATVVRNIDDSINCRRHTIPKLSDTICKDKTYVKCSI